MKLPDIKILVVGGILLLYGGATAYEKLAPVDYRELGISLVSMHCEKTIEDFRGLPTSAESQGIIKKACTEMDVKLPPEKYKEEQAELRSLKESRGQGSEEMWEMNRNVQQLLMLTRRINATSRDTEPKP